MGTTVPYDTLKQLLLTHNQPCERLVRDLKEDIRQFRREDRRRVNSKLTFSLKRIKRIHTKFNERQLNPRSSTDRHLQGSSVARNEVIENMAQCSVPNDKDLMESEDEPSLP